MVRNKDDKKQMGSQFTNLVKMYLGGSIFRSSKGGLIFRGSKRERVVCPLPVGLGTDRRFRPQRRENSLLQCTCTIQASETQTSIRIGRRRTHTC